MMEKVVKLTTILGKIGFCYPIAACPEFIATKWLRKGLEFLSLPKMLQIFLVIFAFLCAVDNSINIPIVFQTRSKLMSDHIYFFLVYVAFIFLDTLIRTSNIYFWEDVSSFSKSVVELDIAMMKSVGRSSAQNSVRLHVAIAVIMSTVMICYGIGMAIEIDILRNDVEFVTCCSYYLLPKNEFLIRFAFVVIDIMPYFSATYALLFIIVHGQILIDLHTTFIERLKIIASKDYRPAVHCCKLNGIGMEYSNVRQANRVSMSCLEDFNAKCIQLEGCFANFGKIGGVYSLAIVFLCTLVTIRAVGVMARIADRPAFNETSFNGVQYLTCFILMIFLANFGTYLQSKVCRKTF